MTVRDASVCTVAGVMSAGMICAHTNSAATYDLSFDEQLDLLEPQDARECVPVGHWDRSSKPFKWIMDLPVCADDQRNGAKVKLSKRAGGIVMAPEAWAEKKTELEVACRELGSRCSYEMMQAISSAFNAPKRTVKK